MKIDELRAKLAATEKATSCCSEEVIEGEFVEGAVEEELDDLWQALVLLMSCRAALNAITELDMKENFLGMQGLRSLEALLNGVDDLVEQYDIEDLEIQDFQQILAGV